jgi:hypothetical protein
MKNTASSGTRGKEERVHHSPAKSLISGESMRSFGGASGEELAGSTESIGSLPVAEAVVLLRLAQLQRLVFHLLRIATETRLDR